jgi:UDP-N-acetylglucosamine/UDP-N-acetylgalactosamine diphosphorylase
MEPSGIPRELYRAYRDSGQEHVFDFWDQLSADARRGLLEQLEGIDLGLLKRLASGQGLAVPHAPVEKRSSAPVVRLEGEPECASRAEGAAFGRKLLAEGKVGVILVAGGQGSRLGFDGPKGCFAIGPLSGKSLFQLHAEKVAFLGSFSGRPLPWYIMVSSTNAAATRQFFEAHRFFGLGEENIFFFVQDMLPAIDESGKLLLESGGRVFTSPNGHGGVYEAFLKSGGLDDAERRGIEHLFHFQVDNALIRMADPLFMGLHALSGAEMSLKVLRKSDPFEKIGVVAAEDGHWKVIEYSDLSEEEARRTDTSGNLVFWAGSIAIHAFRLPFFRRVAEGPVPLPYHVARKRIQCIDAGGKTAQVEGLKFESFVFDALPLARKALNLEVRREEEFAPVKNKSGVDSIETARALLIAEHRRWLREAGASVSGRAEISPLAAPGPEWLRERLPPEEKQHYPGDVLVEPGPGGRPFIRMLRG